ncbi:MAG: hypothetical protein KA765_05375 [Thermoflexales bacterium]|nr:hypothetical protein [Thermoflexales bacterium]
MAGSSVLGLGLKVLIERPRPSADLLGSVWLALSIVIYRRGKGNFSTRQVNGYD